MVLLESGGLQPSRFKVLDNWELCAEVMAELTEVLALLETRLCWYWYVAKAPARLGLMSSVLDMFRSVELELEFELRLPKRL